MSLLIYQLSADAAFESFDDGALILNLKEVTFTELNTTARDIIQVTNGKNSLEQVSEIVAKEYEIDVTVAHIDVKELYDDLLKQGLIEEVKSDMTKERES
jgi:hypothetical protein